MAEFEDREHFIPVRVSELIDFMAEDAGPDGHAPLPDAERDAFRRLAHASVSYYHEEYHDTLTNTKETYAPFDPDADTVPLGEMSQENRDGMEDQFFEAADHLLTRANYRRLTREEMNTIMEGASDWGLEMIVDWEVFSRIEIYVRGEDTITRTVQNLWTLYMKREKEVRVFRRLAMIVKLNRDVKRIPGEVDTEGIYLKLFKDIPVVDMEMVLPGTRIKWTRFDQAMIVYPVATGIGIAIFSVLDRVFGWNLAASLGIGAVASWGFVVALGGYGYRSYYSYTVKKTNYSLQLTESLFFQTLGSNAGVLYRMLDEAEEQEVREALLAYFYLWRYAGEEGWTAKQLDDYIEIELERRAKLEVDFEIDDAVEKLTKLGLAQKSGDRYRVPDVHRAIELIAEKKKELIYTGRPAGVVAPAQLN